LHTFSTCPTCHSGGFYNYFIINELLKFKRVKFIVSSTYLLKQLQVLGGVINSSNTLPILDNFLLDLKKGKLTVSASDLETTMSTVLTVDSDTDGVIAVPARLLLETLKTFPEQPLAFVVENNNTVEISSDHGKYALAYADAAEFPKAVEVADPSTTTIIGDILATAINKTIFAAGNDDLRPVMSGVFFQFSTEGLTFVATDAHKLVKYQRSDVVASQVAEFIMPKKPLNLLKGILAGSESDVTIDYNESNAKFTFDNTELVCRLIDGKYPNYEAVIPKENPNKLTISRNQFLSSVRRVSIFSNKSTHQVRLKIAGVELNISAEDIDYSNKAEERLTCAYNGDDMQIGFNSRFLTEMLNNLDSDDISLEMSLPNRAGILTPTDGLDEGEKVTMLVMPVMLNG
jgi:DNA polymerase-3 subunit beta